DAVPETPGTKVGAVPCGLRCRLLPRVQPCDLSACSFGSKLRWQGRSISFREQVASDACRIKLPRTSGTDSGVRATPEMMADLLVSDLANDGTKLRKEVPLVLQKQKLYSLAKKLV